MALSVSELRQRVQNLLYAVHLTSKRRGVTYAPGSFLGLDSWGVSTSGCGSGLVSLECANAQNSYCELLGGYQETNPGGVIRKLGVITPLTACRKLPAYACLPLLQ